MSGNLVVSFNSPQCGWMSIGFDDGRIEYHTTTAHAPHEFALPELLTILTSLLDESSARNEYSLKWNRDPEAYDFVFRKDGSKAALEIYQYPNDERESARRELVFEYAGEVREVCRSFAATFEQLYVDRETDEFEFNWRQAFPFGEYQEFMEKMKRG